MSGISIFSGLFCQEAAVKNRISEYTGYSLITDDAVISEAAEISGLRPDQIQRAFSDSPSVFNRFTHEKERAVASLKLGLARLTEPGDFIIAGYSGMLLPRDISHVLHVCLIADQSFRLDQVRPRSEQSQKSAISEIQQDDKNRSAWTETLFSHPDPWHPDLHDIVIPMDRTDPADAARLIVDNLKKIPLRPSEASRAAVYDFKLAAALEVELINAGHNVGVRVRNGNAELTISRQVLMLDRLETELNSIARKLPGIVSSKTVVEEDLDKTGYYREPGTDMPSKVLLVDDEREFVQTLSERLQMRDMGAAVTYDGSSALELVNTDGPEVMIIDLKMPGIDGIQVLKQVKQTHPEIEVIVLTGHGSEQDRKTCMALGAFAYFQKPVDIDVLSFTLKKAHEMATAKPDSLEPGK